MFFSAINTGTGNIQQNLFNGIKEIIPLSYLEHIWYTDNQRMPVQLLLDDSMEESKVGSVGDTGKNI